MEQYLESMFAWQGNSGVAVTTILLAMLLSFCIGQVIGWMYMWTHRGLSYSQSFSSTLVVMPVLVCLVMLLMADNLVIAFGLLAVFAVVRFRNVLKDTRDTMFILWTIVQGMAVGTLKFEIAIMGCILISVILAYLKFTMFGARNLYDAVISMQVDGDGTMSQKACNRIFDRHVLKITRKSRRRAGDDATEMSYHVLLRNPVRSDEFLDDLMSAEEFTGVNLFLATDESEI